MVLDTIWVVQPVQEPDLFQDVLPLLKTLLPIIGHLLDGHHLERVLAGAAAGVEPRS